MKKQKDWTINLYIILIFSILIAIPTSAQVEVQISSDNLTWYNISEINQVDHYACQPYLNQSTNYYLRAKNTTTNWTYISARTDGDYQMEIAIIIGLFIISALCAAAMAYFDNELKLFFLLGVFISLVFNLNMMANLAADAGMSATVTGLLWTLYRMLLYITYFMVLYVVIKIFLSLKASKKTALETDNNALMRNLPK